MPSEIFSISMLRQVIDYIEKNLLEELTPTDIAVHFYMSESSLSVLFKTVCEMTIMEYVRLRRLSLASEELVSSDTPIIQLAYKYGYETPEAFTKAFSRFHGFPPSFVRRGFSVSKVFLPLEIEVDIRGGFKTVELTKICSEGQERILSVEYNTHISDKGGSNVGNGELKYRINTGKMQYKREWEILCLLAKNLQKVRIPFKVDGKTLIFAHGLEIPLNKICLTFKWKDEEDVKEFFHTNTSAQQIEEGFKFFDVNYDEVKIRCMFYGNCPGDDADEFLYKNTDLVQMDMLRVPVQSLEFYYENAEKDSEYYKMVEGALKKNEG